MTAPEMLMPSMARGRVPPGLIGVLISMGSSAGGDTIALTGMVGGEVDWFVIEGDRVLTVVSMLTDGVGIRVSLQVEDSSRRRRSSYASASSSDSRLSSISNLGDGNILDKRTVSCVRA